MNPQLEGRMKYIMVTNWENHWDNLKNNKTQYRLGMLKSGLDPDAVGLHENIETIFIKLKKGEKTFEKAWVGRTSNFRKGKNSIEFQVNVEREIICPQEYANLSEGWYVNSADKVDLLPSFMKKIETIRNWHEFENSVYMLLKSIGIHNIYKFDQSDQKGKADGYFFFGNLSVLYDCTLDLNFENSKCVQISNFCAQLKKDTIEIKNKKISIRQHKKAVWIITQNKTSRIMEQVDEIKIKEIAVKDLINLHVRRISTELDSEALEEALINLI